MILGWEVDDQCRPSYWLSSEQKPALPPPDNQVVVVSPENIDTNLIVVAQSGSGKSTFLGRYVEEIILRTQARCLILDPDGDFRFVNKVESKTLWEEAAYNRQKKKGKLPTESSPEDFEKSWKAKSIAIRTNSPGKKKAPYEQLRIWWPYVQYEFLAEGLDAIQKTWFHSCHNFVKLVAKVVRNPKGEPIKIDVLEEAHKMLKKQKSGKPVEADFLALVRDSLKGSKTRLKESYWKTQLEKSLAALDGIPPNIEDYYFARARELRGGVLSTRTPKPAKPRPRIDVVDLSTVHGRDLRLLVANTVLSQLWDDTIAEVEGSAIASAVRASRVPTFVIVDEAHNFVPEIPQSGLEERLKEQFRRIAAEGRKYALFLVLVTQRPDKIDSFVLSECDNKVVMKLNSEQVMGLVSEKLGLGGTVAEWWGRVSPFGIGCVMFIGRCFPKGPKIFYSAARRTEEGGASLQPESWAHP